MNITGEHLRRKNRNLVLTIILFVLQVAIIGISIYFLGGEINIYGSISFIFFILGIPNLVFISTNLVMLYRGEWVYLRFAMDKIKFIDNPKVYLENTFPTISIVMILLAFGISGILVSL